MIRGGRRRDDYAGGMRVALALGSGGARGYAHIGVIDELAARGHEVIAIAGTSMGAVVGGLLAAGQLEEFTSWVTGLTQRDVLRLLDPSLRAPGVIRADRVMSRVEEILGPTRIEELPMPFTAVATDLTARREVWFQRGPAVKAIRASIAIPSAITPVVINGRLLVDGGIVNPVPMEPLLGSPADIIVAVNLSGHSRHGEVPLLRSSDDMDSDWVNRFKDAAAGLWDSDVIRFVTDRVNALTGRQEASPPATSAVPGPDELVFEDLPHWLKTTDVISLSLDAAGSLITRMRMAANPPDVLVEVPLDSAKLWDFHRAQELIDLGRRLAVDALDRAGF